MKKIPATKGFAPLVAVVILAVIGLTVYFVYQKSFLKTKGSGPKTFQGLGLSTPGSIPFLRSKAPGIIISAVTAKGIDPKTGEAVNPGTVFSTNEPNISLVLTIKPSPAGTRFEYVRYLNGKYLDNRSLKTTKNGVKNVSFTWKLKTSTSTRRPGMYTVKVYTQGIFEKQISYTVR